MDDSKLVMIDWFFKVGIVLLQLVYNWSTIGDVAGDDRR
jgi:hypothetical protein